MILLIKIKIKILKFNNSLKNDTNNNIIKFNSKFIYNIISLLFKQFYYFFKNNVYNRDKLNTEQNNYILNFIHLKNNNINKSISNKNIKETNEFNNMKSKFYVYNDDYLLNNFNDKDSNYSKEIVKDVMTNLKFNINVDNPINNLDNDEYYHYLINSINIEYNDKKKVFEPLFIWLFKYLNTYLIPFFNNNYKNKVNQLILYCKILYSNNNDLMKLLYKFNSQLFIFNKLYNNLSKSWILNSFQINLINKLKYILINKKNSNNYDLSIRWILNILDSNYHIMPYLTQYKYKDINTNKLGLITQKTNLIIVDMTTILEDDTIKSNINFNLLNRINEDKNFLKNIVSTHYKKNFNLDFDIIDLYKLKFIYIFNDKQEKYIKNYKINESSLFIPSNLNKNLIIIYLWLSNYCSTLITNDTFIDYKYISNKEYFNLLFNEWQKYFKIKI
jgi:hypothetical protein